ncbi:transcriptional regulator [Spirochaetia bacterium]|nr:transcriptional regulator [Spirochaetia bacterium]
MGISYKPLFMLLIEKGLKRTDLYKMADLNSFTIAKFAKGESISLEILERICKALGCKPSDVFEFVDEETKDG